ncbi:MAG: hypothetical protein L3K23_10225 [Thermoplasmata archaeon]|nr:hypothetical protein [Thermoplasmata archaeon]
MERTRESGTPGFRRAEHGPEAIQQFILQHLRANPGLEFGRLVGSAQNACRASRATVARHLAALVGQGEIVRREDRTYILGEPSTLRPRPVIQVRRYDVSSIIRPSGTARFLFHREFRITSGTLDHFEFFCPDPPGVFDWWCTASSRVSRAPRARPPGRQFTHRVDFDPPLRARKSNWHRWDLHVECPAWYRMVDAPVGPSGIGARSDERSLETESNKLESQRPECVQRFAPNAMLSLQVVFPTGYPVGATECRVRSLAQPDRIDAVEQLRMVRLGSEERGRHGLRRQGNTVTLSVPRPLLDRHYELRWVLPETDQWDRWIASGKSQGATTGARPRTVTRGGSTG